MLRTSETNEKRLALPQARPEPAQGELPARRAAATHQSLWRDLGSPELVDTVRRIYTLCGYERGQAGAGQALAVTSSVEREGKSSIARALAIAIAQDHDSDVLLLECDLVRPSLSSDFGLGEAPGLVEVLSGEVDLAEGLHRSALPNLWILPGGGAHDSPSRLLRSMAMDAVIQEARTRFSHIIVDLPAVLRSSDAAVLAQLVDGVVLVVKTGSTDQRAVQQSLQLLAGAQLHGIVLNRWRSRIPKIIRRLVEG